MTKEKETRMTVAEFYKKAIVNLRKPQRHGIHTVYSGLNDAVRKYFGGQVDPRTACSELIKEGVIEGRPAGGGFAIYLPGEMPKRDYEGRTLATIEKILA